jgi:hypothetical protein
MAISTNQYERLVNHPSVSWICNCGFPNYTSDLFHTHFKVDTLNSFSVLDDLSPEVSSTDPDSTGIPHDFNPRQTSSPTKPKPLRRTKVRTLRGMQINCNGLKGEDSKLDFQSAVEQHNPDIIFGCESKLDEGTPTYSIFSENYEVYRKDRTANGGGVFLAIRSDIVVVDRPEFDSDAEVTWASIEFAKNGCLYLGSYYRPPNSRNVALDHIQDSLSKILAKHHKLPNIILAGDCNFPDIDWENILTTNVKTQAEHNHFINFLNENGLKQLTKEITRPKSGNILDLVMTTNEDLVENITVEPGISDHNLVLFDINMTPRLQKKPPRKIYKYSKADTDDIKKCLEEATEEYFQRSPDNLDVEDNWNFFKQALKKAQDKIPHRTTKGKPSHPFIDRNIIKEMNKRDKLYKKALTSKTQKSWNAYKTKRNEVQRLKRSAHQRYMNEVIGDSLKSDPKKFWSYIKSQKRESINIPTLRVDSKISATDAEKAQILNDQFSSVFTREDASQKPPDKGPSPYPQIDDLTVEPNGVLKQLQSLNSNKASGPDEIPARMLHEYAEEVCEMLAHIFQQTYDTGTLPNDWTKARVVGIYKKGKKSTPSNYRPVSLTCICCKVMEHIVLSHMAKHLATNNILIDNQHGFRAKLSCETQLIESINDWASNIDKKLQTDVLFLDFSKAFDKVAHLKLLHKIRYYGIDGKTNRWIGGFLLGRTQQVSVNGTTSPPAEVLSGVPQGSVLGPALFLLYINDINDGVSSPMRLFADDSVIYRAIRTQKDLESLHQDLQKVFEWAEKWDMKFNVDKCTHVCITLKTKPRAYNFTINGKAIPKEKSCKYLGVTINETLSWNTQSEQVRSKASRTLGLIRRTLGRCSKEVRETAYNTLVRPQLEYATSAWNPHTDRNVRIIESVQRQAARFVSHNYDRTASVSEMLTDLGWDSLQCRRTIHQAEMFYKIQRGIVNIRLPQNINILQRPARNQRSHNHQLAYRQPSTRVDCYLYSMYPRAIRVWNALPVSAVTASNIQGFRSMATPAIRMMGPPPTLKRL